MKFLMEQTNYDVVHEVMEYIDGCDLKKDYSVIVMEWTLHNSQDIMEQVLQTCDGVDLIQPIHKNKKERLILPQVDEKDNTIIQVKILPLEDKQLPKLSTDGLNMLISQILDQEGIANVNGTASEEDPNNEKDSEDEEDDKDE